MTKRAKFRIILLHWKISTIVQQIRQINNIASSLKSRDGFIKSWKNKKMLRNLMQNSTILWNVSTAAEAWGWRMISKEPKESVYH